MKRNSFDNILTLTFLDRFTSDQLKLWKKDYDRVIALAKGAYNSTTVSEMQAESLFQLGRVHHVRHEYENALKLYEKACKVGT